MSDKYFIDKIPPGAGSGKSQRRQNYIKYMQIMLPVVVDDFSKTNRYEVNIKIYFKGRQHADIDNMLKSIFDGMKGRIVSDDICIKKLNVEVVEFGDLSGVEIEVITLNKVPLPPKAMRIVEGEKQDECVSNEYVSKHKHWTHKKCWCGYSVKLSPTNPQ